jgi:hypothetical protein
MATGLGGELLWLCPTLGGDAVDLTGLNTPTCDGGLASIAHTDHGGTRAYSFDGVNDCVTVPENARFAFGTGSFCVSLHAKPTTSGAMDLVQKILPTGSFAGFSCQRVTAARLITYNPGQTTNTSRDAATNVWSHLIFQRIGGQSTVFVNGKCVADTAGSRDVTNALDLKIGAFATGGWGGGWFTGLMDDIRIYNRELTTLERGLLSTPGYEPGAGGTSRPSSPFLSQVIG